MSTVVAEIYGPDYQVQQQVGRQVMQMLGNTADVVDVDWSIEADQSEQRFAVDKDKAMKLLVPLLQAKAILGAKS